MKREQRIAIGIEYDGGEFVGWQRQHEGRSVQAEVERALSAVADAPIEVTAAGRTDAGVHASGQVAHFITASPRSESNWVLGANRHLPPDIALHWAHEVADDFHARFSALARSYRYRIRECRVRPVLERARCAWSHERLDVDAMQAAADLLVGNHDFSAFRAAGCQARSPRRHLTRLALRRAADTVIVEAEANAFLQHMVRNIVGSLLLIGRGQASAQWLGEVLASRDRRRAGPAAPACALTLVAVRYPDTFGLPLDGDGSALELLRD